MLAIQERSDASGALLKREAKLSALQRDLQHLLLPLAAIRWRSGEGRIYNFQTTQLAKELWRRHGARASFTLAMLDIHLETWSTEESAQLLLSEACSTPRERKWEASGCSETSNA